MVADKRESCAISHAVSRKISRGFSIGSGGFSASYRQDFNLKSLLVDRCMSASCTKIKFSPSVGEVLVFIEFFRF